VEIVKTAGVTKTLNLTNVVLTAKQIIDLRQALDENKTIVDLVSQYNLSNYCSRNKDNMIKSLGLDPTTIADFKKLPLCMLYNKLADLVDNNIIDIDWINNIVSLPVFLWDSEIESSKKKWKHLILLLLKLV
jgi:hypothetical protein